MTRGMVEPPKSTIYVGPDTGVLPIPGARDNEVYWWHQCSNEGGWVATGLPLHTLTGNALQGNLTVRASILCTDCGKHGFITENRWAEA